MASACEALCICVARPFAALHNNGIITSNYRYNRHHSGHAGEHNRYVPHAHGGPGVVADANRSEGTSHREVHRDVQANGRQVGTTNKARTQSAGPLDCPNDGQSTLTYHSVDGLKGTLRFRRVPTARPKALATFC